MQPRAYFAEFAGTFAWVFLCAAAVISDALGPFINTPQFGSIGVAIIAGFSYAALLAATLPISGGFLNPAITLALWVFHRIDSARAMGLAAMQFAGAAAAGLAVRGLLNTRVDAMIASRLGTPHLNLEAIGATRVGSGALVQGMGIEAALTFILTFVTLAVYFDPRTNELLGGFARRWANVVIGLMVSAEVLAASRFTGAALNPARWFGTVFWEFTIPELEIRRPLADHAVYWIGPTIGALLAGIVYQYLIMPKRESNVAPE